MVGRHCRMVRLVGHCSCPEGRWGWSAGHSLIGGEVGHCGDDYRRGERTVGLRMEHRVGCLSRIRARLEDGLVR